MEKQVRKINANRTYIYTDQCRICGKSDSYSKLVQRLKKMKKDVFVKQVSLFIGWQNEAAEIDLSYPFVYDCDSNRSAEVETLDEMTDEELKAWLKPEDDDGE